MLLPLKRFALGLCIAAGSGFAAAAQQPPPQSPPADPPPCEAFTKNADGDWVTKRGMTLPGPSGPAQVKAGIIVSDDLQDELDNRCALRRG
jgi:hypothetical protein